MDGHDSEITAAAVTTSSPNDGYGSTEGRTAPGRCALDHGGPDLSDSRNAHARPNSIRAIQQVSAGVAPSALGILSFRTTNCG